MMRRRANEGELSTDEQYGGGVATLEPPVNVDQPRKRSGNLIQRIAQFEITQKKVPRKELMHFSRQLAVFVKAGIPLIESLHSIASEMGNKKFREVLDDVQERLVSGSTLTDAFAAHPEAFPTFYVGMLRTAELSGTLDDVLVQLAEYIERDLDARRKVTSALMYPAVIAGVAIVVVVVMVTFVLPRFRTFFRSLGATLPLPTRMLLAFSDFVTHYWYVFVLLFVAFIGLVLWMQTEGKGKETRDRLLLRIPAVNDLVRHIVIERFCRIMSAMMDAGVPLTDALAVTSDATTNFVYREGLGRAREAMLRGEGLAGPLADTGLFPAAAKQMMRVGEDTGSLGQQLRTAADYYGRELEYIIKRFTSLFEPAVIIFMGAVVGFVAIALVSAMYGIFNQVHP